MRFGPLRSGPPAAPPSGWLVFGLGSERLNPAYLEIRANGQKLTIGRERDAVFFSRAGLWFVAIRPRYLRHPPVELRILEYRRRPRLWPPRLPKILGPLPRRYPFQVWRHVYDPLGW